MKREYKFLICALVVANVGTVGGFFIGLDEAAFDWSNFSHDCPCGANLHANVGTSLEGYSFTCAQCGRMYKWEWTPEMEKLYCE